MSLAGFYPFVPGACVNELALLDPFQAGDIIVIVLGYVIMALLTLQIGVVFWNRKFPPIAAKQPSLLLFQFLGAFCWVTGNYLINDTFPVENQNYGVYCVFRRFWLAYVLGFCFWCSCMIVRFIRLYIVVVKVSRPKPLGIYFVGLLLPVFIISVIALFVESDRSCEYIVGEGEDKIHFVRCKLNTAFAIVTVIIHIAYFLTSVFFIIALRNIRKSFNEYRELRFQIISGIVVYAVLVGLSLGGADVHVAGRSTMSFLYVVISAVVQNLAVGRVSYECLFDREACLARFKEQLSLDSKSHIKNFSASAETKGDKRATVSDSHPSKNSLDETTEKGEDPDRIARVHTSSTSLEKDDIGMAHVNSSVSSLPPV